MRPRRDVRLTFMMLPVVLIAALALVYCGK